MESKKVTSDRGKSSEKLEQEIKPVAERVVHTYAEPHLKTYGKVIRNTGFTF